jgi:hypothetical protein
VVTLNLHKHWASAKASCSVNEKAGNVWHASHHFNSHHVILLCQDCVVTCDLHKQWASAKASCSKQKLEMPQQLYRHTNHYLTRHHFVLLC